jgi:hypothetical protein
MKRIKEIIKKINDLMGDKDVEVQVLCSDVDYQECIYESCEYYRENKKDGEDFTCSSMCKSEYPTGIMSEELRPLINELSELLTRYCQD